MNIEINKKKNAGKTLLQFKGEMNIYTAASSMEKLKQFKELQGDSNMALHVDLSETTEFDTAGLQVLFFLKKQCEIQPGANKPEFQLKAASDCVQRALDTLRLDNALNQKAVH